MTQPECQMKPSLQESQNLEEKTLLTELLSRRKARTKFTEYCRYIHPYEPPAAHHTILCDALDKVFTGDIRNLMVFMPPGSAKSTYATVNFPAYYLGRSEELGLRKGVICASYDSGLATSFGKKTRDVVNSPESQNVFPDLNLSEDTRAKGEWETKKHCTYYSASIGAGITGRRGDLGIIDDPVKGKKEADSDVVKNDTWNWYNTDYLTRLKPDAAQVIIQTRWIDDDLSGRILPEDWDGESGVFIGKDGKTWHVICIQAQAEKGKNDPLGRKPGEWLWTDYFTEEFWKETKQAQDRADTRGWGALYQQRPTAEQGTYFKREWFKRYPLGKEPKYLTKFGASDYAVTDGGGDYTEQGVAGLCPEGDLYIIDWISGQEESDVWVDDLLDLTKKHEPLVWGAEVGQIKRAVSPWLNKRSRERNIYVNVEAMSHVGDKATNARSFQALCKLGMVYIPVCDWGDELVRQLIKFPAGAFDDKVDVCGLMGRLIDKVYEISPPEEKKEVEEDYGYEDTVETDWKTV